MSAQSLTKLAALLSVVAALASIATLAIVIARPAAPAVTGKPSSYYSQRSSGGGKDVCFDGNFDNDPPRCARKGG